MQTKHIKILLASTIVTMMFGFAIAQARPFAVYGEPNLSKALPLSQELHPSAPEESKYDRMAVRVQRRLKNRGESTASVAKIAKALEDRDALFQKKITITVMPDSSERQPLTVTGSIAQFPWWAPYKGGAFSASFEPDANAIKESIDRGDMAGLSFVRDGKVHSEWTDKKKVRRVQAAVIAKPGFVFDTAKAGGAIADAFKSDKTWVTIAAKYRQPTMTVTAADGSTKTLEWLSTGYSDFSDSTPGRLWNVHKAVNEHVSNVLIKDGEKFNLVDALDAPITLEKGWKEALGLFGGGAAMTPGGGICQSATTVYRAALLAGLPVEQKRAHSLYVDHYEFFGVGLDATVFPGVQNLVYRNDTGEDIVMQAYTEGDTVFVNLFGKSDGRSVALDGPYFAGSKNRPKGLRALGYEEIGWLYTVKNADGTERNQPIIARYAKPIPGYVARKFTPHAGPDGIKLMYVSMK